MDYRYIKTNIQESRKIITRFKYLKWITLVRNREYSNLLAIGICNRQLRICNESSVEWSLNRDRKVSLLFVVKTNPLRDGRANRDLRLLQAKSALSCDTNNIRGCVTHQPRIGFEAIRGPIWRTRTDRRGRGTFSHRSSRAQRGISRKYPPRMPSYFASRPSRPDVSQSYLASLKIQFNQSRKYIRSPSIE